MNPEDQRFWDGFLKGVLACEHAVGEASEGEVAIMAIRMIKQRTERLHTENVLAFLKQYEVESNYDKNRKAK